MQVKEKIREERRSAAIAESQDPTSRLRKGALSGGTYKRGGSSGSARASKSGGSALPSIHPYKAAQEMADSEIIGDEPVPDVQASTN